MRPCHKYVEVETLTREIDLCVHMREPYRLGSLRRLLPAEIRWSKAFCWAATVLRSFGSIRAWIYLRSIQAKLNDAAWRANPRCSFNIDTTPDAGPFSYQFLAVIRVRPTPDSSANTQRIINATYSHLFPKGGGHYPVFPVDANLFAYDYEEMAARMAPLKGELLRVVMHPQNLTRLSGLGLSA